MAHVKGYKLKIKRLDYISAVDAGAQGPISNVALIKRATPTKPVEIEATFKVAKTEPKLGLVFGWAMAGTIDGGKTPHIDHQQDAIDVDSDEFLKVCAAFMEAGAASDVMHNEKPDGRIVFALPLTKAIKAALNIQSDIEGLAIAMKPSPETFKRFESGELAAFSIGGIGEREPLPETKRKRRAAKQVLLTSAEAGHQHAIDLDDPAGWCGDRLSTTFAMSEGADVDHAHIWTFDGNTGAITLGLDSGHTHTVEGVVPPAVLALFALNEQAEAKDNAAEALARVLDGETPAASIDVTIAARDSVRGAAPNSTQPAAAAQGGSHKPEIIKMKLAKFLASFLAMSVAGQAHVTKMATSEPDELEAFFGKSSDEREAIAKAAADADPIVFKGELTGLEVRKSHGDLARKSAETAEAMAKQNRELGAQVALAKAEGELIVLKTRAKSDLGSLSGTEETKVALLKAVDGIADEKTRGEVVLALKGANEVAKGKTKAPGYGDGVDDATQLNKRDAYAALEKGLMTFCTEKQITKSVWTEGFDAFVRTPAGDALNKAYEAAKAVEAKG